MLYNFTKGEVDDLRGNYSVVRRLLRWRLMVFFGSMNVAAINALVIHESNNYNYTTRRIVLKNLGKNLLNCVICKDLISRVYNVVI